MYNNYFVNSQDVNILKDLNTQLLDEEQQEIQNKEKILKLKQQILLKGLEISVGFNNGKYNPYY